jgi:type IV secretory pathway VirB4 component
MELQPLKVGTSEHLPVRVEDPHTHILLVGKSGTGKSTSLANWWEECCFPNVCKMLIDPSGTLSKVCYSISKGRVHYCSLDNPISCNPMHLPYREDDICDLLAEAINQVITRTTQNLQMTVKMRGDFDPAVKYCLSKNRKSLLSVRDYIEINTKKSEAKDGLLQRLNFICGDERMVKILCGNNPIKIGELIDKQESFIMDCSAMSREKMIFIGTLLSLSIRNYFRFEKPKTKYKPCFVMIDECANFLNQTFFEILREARKYSLAVVLSTQDLANIPDALVRVMLNVGNIVCYRIGYREASLIARELGTTPEVLQNLDEYHCAYMTFQSRGVAKATSPPVFRKMEPQAASTSKPHSIKWFPLMPFEASQDD